MLIRIPNWLGDALMATPVYENLRKVEPLILFGPVSFIKLLEDFPQVQILPFYPKEFKKNWEFLKNYKNEKGLLLPNSFSSAWLFFRSGLRERMGYATDLRGLLLTKKVTPPLVRMHQRDKYLYLIEKLGYSVKDRDLTLPLNPEKIEKAREFLKNLKISLDEKLVLIAPGAAYGPAKRWPEEYYKKLIERLIKEDSIVLIVGGAEERPWGDFLAEGLKKVYNLCGKTEIGLLAGIFVLSSLLISNDSGLMHLAAALKIPQIAIFGSTDPELTGPLNPKAKVLKEALSCSPCFKRECPYGHYRCLKNISVNRVFQSVLETLS